MRTGFENILTVDGATGAGKTTLLRALAKRYRCVAVELGPLVRTVSWLAERRRMTIADAVAQLALLDSQGRLCIERPAAGALSASEVEIDGVPLQQQIFSRRLAPATAATSLDATAMAWIHGFVRETLRGRTAVLSGREAARLVCPSAGLRIHLNADAVVRAERKRQQLVACGLRSAFVDDAVVIGAPTTAHISIDTTHLDASEVAQRIGAFAELRLGWNERRTAESALVQIAVPAP